MRALKAPNANRAEQKPGDDGASGSAMRGVRAALSAMFATAVEDTLVRSNPVQGVRIPATAAGDLEHDEATKALTRAELALLLEALPAEWRLFFEFLTHTGLRISEVIGLTWAHVDLGKSPKVQVREQVYEGERQRLKSRHARRDIPLSAGMAERLTASRRDSYRGEGSPVFTTAAGTELSRRNLAGRVLKPAAASVGLGVGQLPHVQTHGGLAAVRRRKEHQAGSGVARPRRPGLHAPHLCSPTGRRAR